MARKKDRLGKLPPRYRFALNPFVEVRWSRCPLCEKLTFNRKFPLLITVEGHGPIVMGKTCRYCARCEFIIAHQAELDAELAYLLSQRAPELVGNEYLVMAVVERRTWQKGVEGSLAMGEMLEQTADIKKYYTLHDPRPVWGPADG